MDEMAKFRGMVRRGPWVGSDLNDVFASRAGVDTEPSGVAQDIRFTPSQASRIEARLHNGNFQEPPPDTASNLNDLTNKLPDWSFVQSSGTAITAKWVADTSAGSGGVIRFDVASGAAGDHSYIEQEVVLSTSRVTTYSVVLGASFTNRSASNSLEMWGTIEAMKADGTTTGTDTEFSVVWSSSTYRDEKIAIPANYAKIPSDAQYFRVRIGVKRGAATTGTTGTIDLTECRIMFHGTMLFLADQASLTGGVSPALVTSKDGTVYVHSSINPTEATVPEASTAVHWMALPDDVGPYGMGVVSNYFAIKGALGTNGWATLAFPDGIDQTSVSSTTNILTNQYDAIIVPVIVPSSMKVMSMTIRQGGADGTTRSFAWYLLAQDTWDSTTLVPLGYGTSGNYTAAAVSNRTADVLTSPGYVVIEPGVYWVAVQNTHASNPHSTRMVAAGDWSPDAYATSTTIGNMVAMDTIDTTAFSTRGGNIPMIRLNGAVWDEGAAF